MNFVSVDLSLSTSETTVARLQHVIQGIRAVPGQRKTVLKLVTLLEQVARRRSELLKARWQAKSMAADSNVEAVERADSVLLRTCATAEKTLERALVCFPDLNNGDIKAEADRADILADDAVAISKAKLLHSDRICEVENLRRVVENLRCMETSYDFHGQIICDASMLLPSGDDSDDACDSDYSLENFAYGSTPLSTWLQLMSAIRATGHPTAVEWGVMGSSCGWMVFYAAALTGKMAHGWEILPSLHQCAVNHIPNDTPDDTPDPDVTCHMRQLLDFNCQDALKADISSCGAIVIAGQCWEPWLLNAMYTKIRSECAVGTILLDYNAILQEFQKQDDEGTEIGEGEGEGGKREFQLLCSKSLPVSWGVVAFHVWVLQNTVL